MSSAREPPCCCYMKMSGGKGKNLVPYGALHDEPQGVVPGQGFVSAAVVARITNREGAQALAHDSAPVPASADTSGRPKTCMARTPAEKLATLLLPAPAA